jgi:hypothetical protein
MSHFSILSISKQPCISLLEKVIADGLVWGKKGDRDPFNVSD